MPRKKPIIYWRAHDNNWIRVWRESWGVDEFEVMPRPMLDSLRNLLAGVVEIVEANGD